MKKIACRHLPFSAAQQEELNRIAAASGYSVLWLPDTYEADLTDCEVLWGYFPTALFNTIPGLRWVGVPCAGVERFCQDVYPSDDVVLTNGSGAFGTLIAEYLLTGVLMHMRRMPAYAGQQKQHLWKYAGSTRTICGSTVTVIGMGDIGTSFAERMKALGATVRGVRRSSTEGPACYDAVYPVSALQEAVKDADVVAVCLPRTQETTELISKDILAAMKPDAILCNCGRGATIDEAAMIEALQTGRLGGAVLDVFTQEPLPTESPLWDMENVILTPHTSGPDGNTVCADFLFSLFRDNLERYCSGKPLRNIVDRTKGY